MTTEVMKKKSIIPENVTIYSIESRKGGVGKTTIALNLATVLSEKNSLVLILDFDFLGTSMAEAIEESQYWKKQEILVAKRKGGEDNKDYNVNLIDLLKSLTEGSFGSFLTVPLSNSNKGNILAIGSKFPTKDNNDIHIIIDELHIYGYINLLEKLTQKLVTLNPNYQNYSIIIDHSPGDSCLHNAFNEWIIKNCSVDRAKFIFVSSFDPQDFHACVESAFKIKSFVDKIDLYRSIEPIHVKSIPQEDHCIFYDILDERITLPQKTTNHAQAYISLLLNKVPEVVFNDELRLDFKMDDEKNKLFNEIAQYADNRRYPQNLIKYDDTISLQYMTSRVIPMSNNKGFGDVGNALLNDVQQIMNASVEEVSLLKKMAIKYTSICRYLADNHYKRYANILLKDEKFSPTYPLKLMESAVRNLVGLTFTMGKIGLVRGSNETKYRQSAQRLESFIAELKISGYSASLKSVWQYLFSIAGYKHKGTEPVVAALKLMLQIFTAVQALRYRQAEHYRNFLAVEYNTDYDDIEWNNIVRNKIDEILNPITDQEMVNAILVQFKSFYHDFCYFLLRLIDLKRDIQFMLINMLEIIKKRNPAEVQKLGKYYTITVVEKQHSLVTLLKLQKELKLSEMNEITKILKNNVLLKFNA